MPGLIGFTRKSGQDEQDLTTLSKMQSSIVRGKHCVRDKAFSDGAVCGARVHIGVINNEPQPFELSGIRVWMDGEIYNLSELAATAGVEGRSQTALMAGLYNKDKTLDFLKEADGYFSAVIYDTREGKIHLIIDRFGLRHIYWAVHQGQLVWASEVKAFLSLPGFTPRIDRQSLREYMEVEYILGNKTWFEGVELMPAASILTWDLRQKSHSFRRYWWWDQIKPLTGVLDEEDIIRRIYEAFTECVVSRCQGDTRVGIGLSGGMDSRSILAAMPAEPQIHAVTFGSPDCDDVRFARKACEVKGAVHHIMNLDCTNWLQPRPEGIWWADGQNSLIHMHGIECLEQVRELFPIDLNGVGGCLMMGGSYLKNEEYFDRPVTPAKAASVMGCSSDIVTIEPDFAGLTKSDTFFINNRVRRFNIEGLRLCLGIMETRMPFMGNKLIEVMYSFPDRLRYKYHINRKFLLKYYPALFQDIPWQATRLPISKHNDKVLEFRRKVWGRLRRYSASYGINIDPRNNFTDYPHWIIQEPGRTFFHQTLLDKEALYREYLPDMDVEGMFRRHLRGQDFTNKLCSLLTFEIWLQQVMNKKFNFQLEGKG